MSIESLARQEILAMKPYSSARKEAPGEGVLLNANESPWSLIESTGAERGLNRYPDPQPCELVSALARLYGVEEDNVLVTRGSDEGIDLLTRVFCRAGQDAVLQCPPTFGMYQIAAQTQGAGIVSIPRSEETGFRLDQQAVLEAAARDDRIKLVFLTSPNNPTGDLVDEGFLTDLLDACRGRSLVVMDEAYSEFCRAPSSARMVSGHENLVVLRTLSKAWGAAGLRCGAVLAQPSVISLLGRVIAPYPLPSPVISLALRVLAPDMMKRQARLIGRIRENKESLLSALRGYPFISDVLPGEANFILIRTQKTAELIDYCANRNVILRAFPGNPPLRHWIRFSVGSEQENAALTAVLDEWERES